MDGVLGLGQISICRKVSLQVNFFRWRHFALPSMSLIVLRFRPIWKSSFYKNRSLEKPVAFIASCPLSNSLNLEKKSKSCEICKNHTLHGELKIRGALCRSMSPNFNVPNINVLNINVLHINREWLKFRAHWLYQKLCRSTALYINEKNLEGRLHS